jgi:hypothetical protein
VLIGVVDISANGTGTSLLAGTFPGWRSVVMSTPEEYRYQAAQFLKLADETTELYACVN